MPRGPKKHLKRLNAPSHWMLDKLGGIFVSSPTRLLVGETRRGELDAFVAWPVATGQLLPLLGLCSSPEYAACSSMESKEQELMLLLDLSAGAQAVPGPAQAARVPATHTDAQESPQVSNWLLPSLIGLVHGNTHVGCASAHAFSGGSCIESCRAALAAREADQAAGPVGGS